MLGQLLAPEVLQDTSLDPGDVALEVQQRLDEVVIDRGEPGVQRDPIGERLDPIVQLLLAESPVADLGQLRVGPPGPDSARAFESRISPLVGDSGS